LFGAGFGLGDVGIPLDQCVAFLARQGNNAVGLFLSLRQDAIFLGHGLLRLLDFLGDGHSHLIDDVQHAFLIDDNAVSKPERAAFIEEFFQSVNQMQNIHTLLHGD